ncbi:MAG: endolytic transglycosylase MltG [Bacteroidetes bacterium]|nr:endolytic transglycosylase MltG [Bacteroidota bacterium]
MKPSRLGLLSQRRQSCIAPFTVTSITLILFFCFSARFYFYLKSPNVDLKGKAFTILYIPTSTDFAGLVKILNHRSILKNEKSFIFISERKHYQKRVKPGKYRIQNGISNNELINQLRLGRQEPVLLSFQNIRTVRELAGKLSHQVEADSASLMKLFKDGSYLKQFGINPENIFVLFIPNSYQVFWNISAKQLLSKMSTEQQSFWDVKRRKLLDSAGLTIQQLVTLASIVEKETNKDPEKPDIAGVYINRLHKGWPLQADPTIIYAWQDYSIRRLTSKHLKIDSPYNTYLHTGLPPGPICIPSISSIDAVLHFRDHRYMYFCAREDFSGYHNFAVTGAEHGRNARKYQNALDNLNIK